jgi:phosphoglycerate dehydrogenase-like enzyme
LDELFQKSDFISLHCRLEDHTRGMIGEREFRLMKPTAYFINVARGELVQQDVLVRCLRERWIAGAALDVFEEEPLPADNPLIGLDNVILTPHWLPATAGPVCNITRCEHVASCEARSRITSVSRSARSAVFRAKT